MAAPDGTRIPGARIDVWQADEQGSYDVESGGRQPLGNGRGLFTADDEGRFRFRSIVPAHYPIPPTARSGALRRTRRHPYRPAHVHFIVEAPGYVPVTTHVFVEGSEYLESDAVFAVKQPLVRDFATVDDAETAELHGLPNPFRRARFDIVLEPRRDGVRFTELPRPTRVSSAPAGSPRPARRSRGWGWPASSS